MRPLILVKGECVTVGLEGRTVEATVVMVSKNGASLAVEFEDMLGGYVAMMPVLWQDGEYRDLIGGRSIEIIPKGERDDAAGKRG